MRQEVFQLNHGDAGLTEYRIRPDGRLERRLLDSQGMPDTIFGHWHGVDAEDIVRHVTWETAVGKWLVTTLRRMTA